MIIENAELLIYLDGKLHITILGGIKLTGLDRMKVTLKLTRTDHKQNTFRHNLDPYNSIQTEQLIEKSAEALNIRTNEISTAISQQRLHQKITGRTHGSDEAQTGWKKSS